MYQMHHIDRDTPWEEIWQAMEQLIREGKVLYVGSSNFAGCRCIVPFCGKQSRSRCNQCLFTGRAISDPTGLPVGFGFLARDAMTGYECIFGSNRGLA